jgi:hypothetical protein
MGFDLHLFLKIGSHSEKFKLGWNVNTVIVHDFNSNVALTIFVSGLKISYMGFAKLIFNFFIGTSFTNST